MADNKEKKYLGKAGLTRWQMRGRYLVFFLLSLFLVYITLVLKGFRYWYFLFLGVSGMLISLYGFFKPNPKHFEPKEDDVPPET